MTSDSAGPTPPWLRQDFAAGLVVTAVAAFALWHTADLAGGTLGAMGAGMMPRVLAILFGALGLLLSLTALLSDGERLERWTLRGPVMILASVVIFGITVRPLGLTLAGPLAIIVAGAASPETRWTEALVFSVLISAFCILLFKFALGLPIPLAPWALGY